MTHEEYISKDAAALGELVRNGEVAAAELLELALDRQAALNPHVNAIVHLMVDDARRDASRPPAGPFAGVPFLAKDFVTTYRGHPTSAGTAILADRVADHDSELAKRVRATGVSVFGKTNTPEWGLMPFTEPRLWGACRNPWSLDRTPGGSSGGSAAAVACGIVPMAGGGDGGGSIRIPASCCGLFGLKPTRGRTPTGPDQGLVWRGAVVEHVLTRSVRDSAIMLDATQGPDTGAPLEIAPPLRPFLDEASEDPSPFRIAWSIRPTLGSSVHDDCVAAVEDAAELLTELGHEVSQTDGPAIDAMEFKRAFMTMMAAELAADMNDAAALVGRRTGRRDVEPVTWVLALLGRALSGSDYADAMRTLERAGRKVGAFFSELDLLLTPTVASPPPKIGELAPSGRDETLLRVMGYFGSGRLVRASGLLDELAATAFDFLPWTPVYNVTGQPAMSVPLHWNASGLPVGVHFVGPFGGEGLLFRLAFQLERARPWLDRLPELARSHP